MNVCHLAPLYGKHAINKSMDASYLVMTLLTID